jgi:hypothetical protein
VTVHRPGPAESSAGHFNIHFSMNDQNQETLSKLAGNILSENTGKYR